MDPKSKTHSKGDARANSRQGIPQQILAEDGACQHAYRCAYDQF